jgi:MFS family permease
MSTINAGSEKTPKKGIYYGWYIIAAMFFVGVAATGSRMGFGVFVETWEKEWGVSTAAISLAAAIGALVSGVAQPIFGRLTDKYGGRRVMILSLAVSGVATIGLATVSNVFGLIILYGFVLSFVFGGVSPTIKGVVIARWFERRRGMAMGILMAGAAIGAMIVVPFLSYALIEFGWKTAWVIIGIVILVLGLPVLYLVVRNTPQEMGMNPDGDEPVTSESGEVEIIVRPVGPSYVEDWKKSYRSAPMWQLTFGFLVCGITSTSMTIHFVRWAISEDVSVSYAAFAFGVLSVLNAVGVFTMGMLSDKMQRKNLLGIVYLTRAVAFISLIVFPGNIAVWAFAFVGGVSWLATVPMTSSLTADVYGTRNLGTLSGFTGLAHSLGGAAAVLLFGLAFTAWGSYDVPFAIGALTLVAAGIVSLSIREKDHSVRYVQVPAGSALDSSEDGD